MKYFSGPDYLTEWVRRHTGILADVGIKVELTRSPEDGRTNASVWIHFETNDRMARLTVWDSRDCEVEFADIAAGIVRPWHRSVRSMADLEMGLTAAVDYVTELKGDDTP
jgi:hypothetical protein